MSTPESFSSKFIYFFCYISYGLKVYPEQQKCGRTDTQTDKSLLLTRTSGAGSRASAEQFVGSYDLVEFILVLVGDTIRKSAIRPLKNGPRAHKSKLIYPQSFFCITESSVAKIETQLHFCRNEIFNFIIIKSNNKKRRIALSAIQNNIQIVINQI